MTVFCDNCERPADNRLLVCKHCGSEVNPAGEDNRLRSTVELEDLPADPEPVVRLLPMGRTREELEDMCY